MFCGRRPLTLRRTVWNVRWWNSTIFRIMQCRKPTGNCTISSFSSPCAGQGSAGDRIRALPGNMAPAFAAEGEYLQGRKRLLRGDSAAVTKDYFERALKLDPNNEDVRHHIYGHVMQTVRNLMGEDRYADAEPYLRQAVELQSILKVDPGDAGALFSLAHLEAAREIVRNGIGTIGTRLRRRAATARSHRQLCMVELSNAGSGDCASGRRARRTILRGPCLFRATTSHDISSREGGHTLSRPALLLPSVEGDSRVCLHAFPTPNPSRHCSPSNRKTGIPTYRLLQKVSNRPKQLEGSH